MVAEPLPVPGDFYPSVCLVGALRSDNLPDAALASSNELAVQVACGVASTNQCHHWMCHRKCCEPESGCCSTDRQPAINMQFAPKHLASIASSP